MAADKLCVVCCVWCVVCLRGVSCDVRCVLCVLCVVCCYCVIWCCVLCFRVHVCLRGVSCAVRCVLCGVRVVLLLCDLAWLVLLMRCDVIFSHRTRAGVRDNRQDTLPPGAARAHHAARWRNYLPFEDTRVTHTRSLATVHEQEGSQAHALLALCRWLPPLAVTGLAHYPPFG